MAPRQDGEAPPCSPTAPEHARRGDRARPSNRRQAFPSTSRNCVRISHGSRMAVPARSLERVTLGLSAIVPLARIYVGAHLPIDVVGGSFFGLAIGFSVRRSFQTVGNAGPRRSGPS
jgi:hypothetical protein